MKKITLIMSFLLSIIFLTGCDDSGQEEQDSSSAISLSAPSSKTVDSKIKIALVMKTLTNPFFVSMEKGARRAESDLDIELIVKTAAQETSTNQQISLVEKLVRDGEVQAIVIAPADSVRLIPSLKKAIDQGIHVVNIDNRLNDNSMKKAGLSKVPFLSIDNELGAYKAVNHVVTNIDNPTEVAILEGIREASNANARHMGALKALGENKNITIVASETAHWQVDEAYEVTKAIFGRNPNVGVIFAANDMMAIGAIEYLREIGKSDVKIASFDAIAEAKAAIAEGWLHATIDQQPEMQGYLGVKTALDLIKGENVPDEILLNSLLITSQDLN